MTDLALIIAVDDVQFDVIIIPEFIADKPMLIQERICAWADKNRYSFCEVSLAPADHPADFLIEFTNAEGISATAVASVYQQATRH